MIRVYGSSISYYAGKLEAYLRYRGHAYELLPMTAHEDRIRKGAGAVQSPVVELEDGRWLSDTTPILAWFEAERGGTTIYPEDPGMRFLALLLEDHADEWLWRPAMHYRWSHRRSREYASSALADEMMAHLWWPRFIGRRVVAHRQLTGFVKREGVNDTTVGHVEATSLKAFALLEAMLDGRPYLWGERPTIVDYGFVGPMFRHYAQDPVPAELVRTHAPRVFSWVARMWEATPVSDDAPLLEKVGEPEAALLREACETHLVQLRENARGHAAGQSHFAQDVQGVRYEGLPVSRYRVWCLEELRRHWAALDATTQEALRTHLVGPGASVLWDDDPQTASGYDPERQAPFNRAINVFGTGVPK